MPNNKTKIIVLEGASGSGKTSIQTALFQALTSKGFNVKVIKEFSDSPLGELLKNAHGLHKIGYPHFLKDFAGALAYLSDKTYGLENSLTEEYDFLIFDRYFLSQIILGGCLISDHTHKSGLKNVVISTHHTFKNSFHEDSLFFILQCGFKETIKRIENRESITLTKQNKKFVLDTASGYKLFDYDVFGWQYTFVSTDLGISNALNQILFTLKI